MDPSGARFLPKVDLAHDDDDTRSRMSDIPLQLPASAQFSAEAGSDPVRNVFSLQPIPNQTGVNPWQLQNPAIQPQSVPAVLGPQETVQLVAQRAREPLHGQRETARRALLHQQG